MSLRDANKINTYGIRTSLGRGLLSTQIQFGSKLTLRLANKPITLGSLAAVIGSTVGYSLLYQFTILKYGGFWGTFLMSLGYFGLCILLFTRTKTLNYKTSYVPAIILYWRKGGRFVPTFFAAKGAPLKHLTGIKDQGGIDEDGLLHFTNGEVGVVLDVVGNASTMIFEEDQKSVIKDARTLYKNLPPLLGLTLVTQASTQDVHLQIHSKLDQLHNLQINSSGLRQVIKKQGLALRDRVGNKFSMIRQYLIVRGEPDDVEITVRKLSQSASNLQSNYLKSVEVLTNEPLRKGIDGLPMNEPYQLEKFLGSVFNDYQGK